MVPVLLTGWAPNRTLISRSHTLLRRKGCGYPRDTTMADSDIVANPYDGLPPNDRKRWVCIYPAYLNSRKTLSEGRRIPKSKAVENPLCTEIRDVCMSQHLEVEFESTKHYPRDHLRSGRVRVQLKTEAGLPVNPNIVSRKDLCNTICELIPKLKTRQTGSKAGGADQSTGGGSGPSGGGMAQSSSKKKKGRRK